MSFASFTEVSIDDPFWSPRLDSVRSAMVPIGLEQNEPAIENLRRVGFARRGEPVQLLPLARYVSSDLYKVMEGASYLLALERDPVLEARLDAIIDVIGAAQADDGYLYEPHQVPQPNGLADAENEYAGDRPYAFEDHSHETYDVGHLYEAA